MTAPPTEPRRLDPWRPGPPLLAFTAGWLATVAWNGMVAEPFAFLVPMAMVGVVMVLLGSGLRVLRWSPYVVAGLQALVALLGVNLVFASRWSFLGLIPTEDSVRQVGYVIANGAATLNAYAAPVTVNPTHTRALLMLSGLGVLFMVDVLAFGMKRPPLVALPLLVALSVPVSILDDSLALPVFIGVGLLFFRLLAEEHLHRITTWGRGGGPARRTRPRVGMLWQAGIGAVVLALVVAPLIPVADLINPDRGGIGGDSAGGSSGFQLSTVNPFILLRRDLIAKTHTPLLYAETDARQTGYIRTAVLDQFREDEWRPSPRDLPRENAASGDFPSPPGLAAGLGGETDEWSFQFAPRFTTTWLPLPYPIRSLEVKDGWRYDSETLDVAYVGDDDGSSGLAYDVTSFTPSLTAPLLDSAVAPSRRIERPMTALPDNLPGVVRERAREVTQGATTDYQKAVALQDWFRQDGGFTYSLEPRPGSGMDLLAAFITDDRIGYCEQFAAAMAAMGRALGIPSRVAVGFLDGTVQPDGRILYTSDDRHAWPEMYFAGAGWVRFEPTPGQRAGATPPYTRQDVNAPDPTTAPSATSAPTRAPDARDLDETSSSEDSTWSIPLWPVVAVVILVLLLAGPGVLRRAQRRRRLGAQDPVHLAEGAWAELHATALDLGLEWPEGSSPRQQAGRVIAQVPDAQDRAVDSLQGLLTQVERGRYAGVTEGGRSLDEEERTRTVETVESWRQAMLASVDRERGWRGRLWPVSLLRRR